MKKKKKQQKKKKKKKTRKKNHALSYVKFMNLIKVADEIFYEFSFQRSPNNQLSPSAVALLSQLSYR
jgi:hypothetical protein